MPKDTPTENPIVFPISEPCNRATEEEYTAHKASIGLVDSKKHSKDPISSDVLSDTGGTL